MVLSEEAFSEIRGYCIGRSIAAVVTVCCSDDPDKLPGALPCMLFLL